MKLHELTKSLADHPQTSLQMILADETRIPNHFHLTEVGFVRKDFVDCGGTVRSSAACVLQVWVANDLDHRLDSSKLLQIINLADRVLPSKDVPVEIEYEHGVISQFPLSRIESTPLGLTFHLGTKHTACLAPDLCLVDSGSCCGTPDCC